jgi:hypothetical protein
MERGRSTLIERRVLQAWLVPGESGVLRRGTSDVGVVAGWDSICVRIVQPKSGDSFPVALPGGELALQRIVGGEPRALGTVGGCRASRAEAMPSYCFAPSTAFD